jgi:ATP-dependent Clp protease ATP-binding subunit ClpC
MTENRDSDMQSVLEDELKKKFPPEFINRIDEVIYFNDLKKEDIQKIIHLELDKSIQRLRVNGFESEVNQDMIDHLIKVGYDPKFGARPLKRAIQRWIDDPVTDILLEGPDKDVVFQISYDESSNKTKIDLKKPFKAKRVKKSDS